MNQGFKNWLLFNEMPAKLHLVPNDPKVWDKDAKKRYGWDRVDAGIVSSEAGRNKFLRCWDKTPHEFKIFLVRNPYAYKFAETGKVSAEWVRDNIRPEIPFEDYQPDEESITIF